MKTMRDVYEAIGAIKASSALFGVEEGVPEALSPLMESLGRAICEENSQVFGEPGAIENLPKDTPLGPKATEALGHLEEWLLRS